MTKKAKSLVKNGKLLTPDSNGRRSIDLGSKEWYRWLERHKRFVYQGEDIQFTARRETRRGKYYWYGYCRRSGKLHKVYLGKASELTLNRLTAAGETLKSNIEDPANSVRSATADPADTSNYSVASFPDRKGIRTAKESFVLNNRLTPPPLPTNLIDRPRLTNQISKPITLISAPSGFGKTTLVNQWQNQRSVPVVWLSLEAWDNEVHVFLGLLTLAMQYVDQALGDNASSLLRSPSPISTNLILSSLIESLDKWLSAAPGRQLALIIDNYHQVHGPEFNALFQYFLDRLPMGVQVVITSELAFSFNVKSWRKRGLLTELTIEDLSFTSGEGVAYLDQVVSDRLTAREKSTLALKVGGWIAGLNILASALGKQDAVHQYLAAFDGYHPHLHDYLVQEILGTQPPDIQRFILQTAILRNLSGPLCDCVTQQDCSQHMLQKICQESQLLKQLDDQQEWFQYHELFSQSLQQQLQIQSPEEINDLHLRAAKWYQAHELYSEAIDHFVAASAWPNVTALIDQVIIEELRRGSDHDVLKWLQQLPDDVFLNHRTLAFTYARLGASSLPQGHIQNFLRRMASRIEAKPISERTPNEQAIWVDLNHWDSARGRGPVSAEPDAPLDEIGRLWRMLDLRDLGLRLIGVGKIASGERMLLEAIDYAKAQGMLFVVIMVGLQHVTLIASQGRLRQAETLVYDLLEWARHFRGGSLPACASVLFVVLSKIYYARNQISEANDMLEEAAVLDPHPTSANLLMFTHGILAHILMAQGDPSAAQESLRLALDLEPYFSSLFSIDDLKIHQAILYLRNGDLVMAEQILREVTPNGQQLFKPVNELYIAAWATLFLAQEKYQEAEAVLNQLQHAKNDRLLFTFPLQRLIFAQVYWSQYKVSQAKREIEWAVRAAEPEGITRPFLDCGPQIIPLLCFLLFAAKLSSRQRRFVRKLLRCLRAAHPTFLPPTQEELANRAYAAKISPREHEILQLVAEGLTNKELASRLIITDSTVRTHLRNIYRKLEVESRTQAIRRARELQLL